LQVPVWEVRPGVVQNQDCVVDVGMGPEASQISNWLNKRKAPSLSYWLKLQTLAKKIRRRKA
jgi:hypothetical protein